VPTMELLEVVEVEVEVRGVLVEVVEVRVVEE